jgi:cell division ATPase FtsA
MPVKLGIPSGIEELPENIMTPEFATAIGLVNYGYRHEAAIDKSRGGFKGIFKKIENWLGRNF